MKIVSNTKKDENSASGEAIDPGTPLSPAEQQRMQLEQSHPFVKGMANAGAILGRDIGVLALRAVEGVRDGGLNAVLYWTGDRVPEAIRAQMTDQMRDNLHGAMIVPQGARMPLFTFHETQVRTASRVLADGSQLIIFEEVKDAQQDAASA